MSVNGRNIKPMILIMIPILLLIGMGVLYTNFNSSGFSTTADSSTCTQINCPSYLPTGCAEAISNCTFTGSTSFSFLDPNSPFTDIVDLNMLGFIESIAGGARQHNPTWNYQFQLNVCGATSSSLVGYNMTCADFGTNSGTAPFPPTCGANGFNVFSQSGNNTNYLITAFPVSGVTCNTQYQLTGFYFNDTLSGKICQPNGTSECFDFQFGTVTYATTAPNFGNAFEFLGFLIGIILLVLALGVGFQGEVLGTGFRIQPNSQGSKLTGALGLGLILWIPFYSEFSSWISLFGFGVDTIITAILTGIFFVGIYWQSQSYF
jgi:hypothetical protein